MNTCVLIGRLTKDPELRHVGNNNTPICNFTVAVNRRFKKEGQPDTDFFNIVAIGKTGEFCNSYFNKGLRVAIKGTIQNDSWEKDGQKHYMTRIIADQVDFADGKNPRENSTPGMEPVVIDTFSMNDNPFV